MIDIAKRLSVIKALLEKGSEASLTYAALECRLSIEQVCYDRLKMSYGHISYDDLTKWQPRHVVRQVVEDANELAASEFTLSMSKEPVPSDGGSLTKGQFEALEYVKIGEQAGLDISKLGKLWNALSRVALHTKLPTKKSDDVRSYGDLEEIKRQVCATLEELEKLKSGTLLSSALGTNYYFPCIACKTEIRRIQNLLKPGQVVNCVNPNCKESYLIHKEDGEITHSQRSASIQCDSCGEEIGIAQRLIDDLESGDKFEVRCDSCSNVNLIKLIPVLVKKAN
jgi:ribosomal protein S27E